MTEDVCRDDNVRAASFYVMIATTPCPRCRAPTRVLAVALPAGHDGVDESMTEWAPVPGVAILSFVARIPAAVSAILREHAAGFRLDPWQLPSEGYWANSCLQCTFRFDDEALHSEPDVAFLPSSEAQAAQIELHHVLQPITACARGLSLAPQFFNAMRRV